MSSVAFTPGTGGTIETYTLSNSNKVSVVALGTISGSDGAGTLTLASYTSNGLKVDGSAVTQPVSGSVTSLSPTASNFNAQVVGSIAHDAVDSGNPIKIGGKARIASWSAVGDGDRVDTSYDKMGRQVVMFGNVRELKGYTRTTLTASTAETTIIPAIASTFNDLTGLVITNSGVATVVTIRETTAGNPVFVIPLAATTDRVVISDMFLPQTTVNTNWTAQCSVASTSVVITCTYDKNL